MKEKPSGVSDWVWSRGEDYLNYSTDTLGAFGVPGIAEGPGVGMNKTEKAPAFMELTCAYP